MTSARGFASLSSTLLARKGGARPAMRSPLAPAPESAAPAALDDLGWNDMGDRGHGQTAHDHARPGQAQPVMFPPAALHAAEPAEPLLASKPVMDAPPAAVVQLVRAPSQPRAAALTASLARPVLRRTRPAAFTLRLEPDRHYRLRLACAQQARSAQSLVTEALDRFLSDLPELEPLAGHPAAQRSA